jgi:glycosyltransferase involved in cell wall biosynthesis
VNIIQVPRRFVRSEWGGSETVILETSKNLIRMGHSSQILCPNALATDLEEVIDGVPVHRFPYFYPYLGLSSMAKAKLDRKGGNLFSFSTLKALGNIDNLDLIHLHTGKRLGGIGRHAARKQGIPYIVSLHGGFFDVPANEAQSWTDPTRKAFEWGKILGWWVGSRRVLQDAAAIICVSEEEQKLARQRFPGQRTEYLPNGVDFSRFSCGNGSRFRQKYGIHGEARVLLNVGRIDPQKNQTFLIPLLARLIRSEPQTHLILIGPVTNLDYLRRLRELILEEDVEKNVTLIQGVDPRSEDLVDAYHASDLFLLPSRHEPFGIVALEAWSAGLPVVASRIGGVPSFVSHEVEGFLFEPGDAEECEKYVMTLLNQENLSKAIGTRGRAKAEHEFSWDAITKRLLNIYEAAIHEYPFRQ